MDYNLFLFIKLHEVCLKPIMEYDLLFGEVLKLYDQWEEWDEKNGDGIGTYESILKFLEK
jgi:hypothetical protein